MYKLDYEFYPKSFVLPDQIEEFRIHCKKEINQTYICKPFHLACGRGIFLERSFDLIKEKAQKKKLVAQRYIDKPYLINGFKFDFRVYCLVYGIEPLRIYIFEEGIARFATVKYQDI